MANQIITDAGPVGTLPQQRVALLAAIFLVLGLGIGYLISGQPLSGTGTAPQASAAPSSAAMGNAHMPSMEEMKQMADKQAAPLLQKLRSNPNDPALLAQLGSMYHIAHQFSQAAAWYGRASQADPKNVELRTKFAISLYRSGDVDGSLAQLNEALREDPKDANCLFNLGMIRLQGKADGKGALAAWQQLLKSNPQLSPDRKAVVTRLMADVMTTMDAQPGTGGGRNHGGHKPSID
ncbi:MAG TPA: tetratricopeptide repeat protein [Acidobacteriaceae bacterium]|jgi:cytochrome c-type biogenesis protein CcmH/NrfG|nr:tetratricopeptide repeat protein [Acidobacteriaceae bacterium]